MAESQSEAPQSPDFSFPPYRRKPLRSETYLTFVRIMSRFHDQPQCLLTTPQISAQNLKSVFEDNGSNQLVQACENSEPVGLGCDTMEHRNLMARNDAADDRHHKSSGSQEKVVGDTHRTIGEIEDIMGEEEAGDKVINESTKESGREQMILDELQNILDGKVDLAQENGDNLLASPVKENDSFNDIFAVVSNEEDHIDLQQVVMEEPGDTCQLQVDKEDHSQKVLGSIDSSSDKNVCREVPELNDNSAEKNSSLETSALKVEHGMQLQGEMELVKPAPTRVMVNSPTPMIEDEDVEEGELSGDFSLDDMSLGLFSKDAIVSEDKNKDEMQVSEGLVDKQDFRCNEISDAKEKDSDNNSPVVDSGGKVETNGSCSNKIDRMPVEAKKANRDDCTPENERNKKEGSAARESFCPREARSKTLVYYGDILEQNSSTPKKILEENTAKSKELLSAEQENADNLKKKTQGSRGGSKKRKTEKKRKKRAETNRQLGVKRLKLLPEVKKAVSYCRHYLKGRCHEGEKCKFSHDTVPLTKSKPCCHFARNSCMKGDDCPFDHDLSKYPCNNYTSTGFCARGDGCMFSHQMALKEDSPANANASKLELKPTSLLGDSTSKKQPGTNGSAYQNVNALSSSVGMNSQTKTAKNVAETILKSAELAPKGISFISLGKPSMVESSKPQQVSSYPKIDNGAKVGHQIERRAPPTVQILNETPKRTSPPVPPKGISFLSFGKPLGQIEQKAPSTVQISNETPKRTPPVAPKGINFLSFGKPLGSLNGTVSSNRDGVGKLSLLDNQIISKPASSLPTEDNCVSVGKQKAESALGPVQNDILKKIQPAEASLGAQALSSVKSSVKLNSQDGSSQEKQSLSDKPQNSSANQWKMLAPLTPGESSKHSASGTSKNTPNSMQKALWSTLAFAAKYDSGLKLNRTTGTLAPNAEANKEIGTTGSGKAKASDIFEFLSGIGNKTKQ